MKFIKLIKNLVAPSANESLAKFDANLLADIGVITICTRSHATRIPADLGLRLI